VTQLNVCSANVSRNTTDAGNDSSYRQAFSGQLNTGMLRHRHLQTLPIPCHMIKTWYCCFTAHNIFQYAAKFTNVNCNKCRVL